MKHQRVGKIGPVAVPSPQQPGKQRYKPRMPKPEGPWATGIAVANAISSCTHCYGIGIRERYHNKPEAVCCCVLRSIFRACHAKFRACVEHEMLAATVLDQRTGPRNRGTFGFPSEEFTADFCKIARRALCGGTREIVQIDSRLYRIFRLHYLLGASWKLCCERLNMERGDFFHDIYRIEEILGRAFVETTPYPLFPLDHYFGCHRRDAGKSPGTMTDEPAPQQGGEEESSSKALPAPMSMATGRYAE